MPTLHLKGSSLGSPNSRAMARARYLAHPARKKAGQVVALLSFDRIIGPCKLQLFGGLVVGISAIGTIGLCA